MKKNFILGLALSLVLLITGSVLASQTFTDIFADPPYPPNVPYTAAQEWTGANGGAINNVNHDVIGTSLFATQSITLTSAGQLKLDITTNIPGSVTVSGNTFYVADIGLNVNSATTTSYNSYTTTHSGTPFASSVSPYELGIIMSGFTGTDSGNAPAYLVNVTTWGTSYSKVNPLGGGWGYGGAWRQSNDANPFTKPVETKIEAWDTSNVLTGTMSWAKTGTFFDGSPEYLITVLFANYGGLTGTAFDFIWGTATCANDVIARHADAQVPVPPSVLLLGTGLLGLVGLRRFRKI